MTNKPIVLQFRFLLQKTIVIKLLFGLIILTHHFNIYAQHVPKLRVFTKGKTAVTSVIFNSEGNYFAAASGKIIQIWDINGDLQSTLEGHTDKVLSIAFSPDGNYIASGSRDCTIKLWKLSTQENINTFYGHDDDVSAVVFNPRGNQIVSGSLDNTIKLWHAARAECIFTYYGHTKAVTDLAFHPDEKHFISCSKDKTIRKWNIGYNSSIRVYKGHRHFVTSVDFNFDGTLFVSSSFDGNISIWKNNSSSPLISFQAHDYAINTVKFNPNNKSVISGSVDNTVKEWNIFNGRNVRTIKNQGQEVNSLDISSNGKYLLTGTPNKIINLWDSDIKSKSEEEDFNTVKVWAVIVGISKYNHVRSLSFADDDAYQMYAFLKSPKGGALPDSQIKLLIDESAEKKAILYAMDDIYGKADKDDVIIFYFSGHGKKDKFLPHDYNGSSNELLHSEVIEVFKNSPAKYKLCIADACFAGSLEASKSDYDNTVETYYNALVKAEGGLAVMMSSKSEETSIEYKGLRQGVFSYFLIEGLKGKANSNYDHVVTISELFNYVRQKVMNYTDNHQCPLLHGTFDKDMPLAGVR